MIQRVEHIGFFSKLKSSIIAFVLSFVIILVAVGLLAWNEHRTLKNHKGLVAAAESVIGIDPEPVDPAHQGKLVHFSAEVSSDTAVGDELFGLSRDALVLKRKVEMYQWREKQETEERDKIGGGTERITTYTYEKAWDDERIDSSRFEDTSHRNPDSFPYDSERFVAENAMIGAYVANDAVISALKDEPLALDEAASFPEDFRLIDGSTLYSGGDPDRPEIGDVRIRFSEVPYQIASLIAEPSGNDLVPWTSPAGTSILLVEPGQVDAATVIERAQSANTTFGWIFRAGGVFALFIAFMMMFAPLSTAAGVLPPIGRLVGKFAALAALMMAVAIGGLTILLSWIVVRPLYAIAIVVAIVAAIAWWSRRRATPPPPPPAMSMPPPPARS
jgi:hypothetical protein